MLVIEVDDADLRRAATVYLSTLSGEAQKATRATAEDAREHIASGAYWTNRTGKTGGRSGDAGRRSARRHAVQRSQGRSP